MSETIENTSGSSSNEAQAFQAAEVEVPSYRQRRTIGQLLRGDLGFIPVLITLIVIMVFFQIITGGLFFEPRNISKSLFANIHYRSRRSGRHSRTPTWRN